MKKIQLPQQPGDIDENRQAFAPYNFVSLPDKIVTQNVSDLPDQGVYASDRLTGYIDCELTTESPIYIRAGVNRKQVEAGKQSKDIPDFFYLNDADEPVIPGSSLRGMLRTLVEIVTYSKVSLVSRKRLIYRSVGGATNHDIHYRDKMMRFDGDRDRKKFYTPRILGGYMKKLGSRDWAIRPAKVVDGTTYAHIRIDEKFFKSLKSIDHTKNAYQVFIKTSPYDYQDVRGGFLKIKYAKVQSARANPESGFRPATLARSGAMISKLSEAVIYEPDPDDTKLLSLTDEQIDDYKEQISQEQEKLLGKQGVLNDGQPVFYILDEKTGLVEFFGHARMFRVPYPNSPFDYIPPSLREGPPHEVDFAEAIFGYARDIKKEADNHKQRAYAGRLFFTDAILHKGQKDLWLPGKTITPKILSGPKPTTFQHYLVQEDPNSYKIGETRDGKSKFETRLRDYASPKDETTLRGHKFYWHKGARDVNDIRETSDLKVGDTQHTQINPLRAGVTFAFQVHFENLSKEELGALMFVLDIIASNEKMRLKLGMGKPLGMGAVKISPKLFVRDIANRYASLFGKDSWLSGYSEDAQVAQSALDNFMSRMEGELGEGLTKSDRIKELLAILQWPGIAADDDGRPTRYMEIEHKVSKDVNKRGKVNEYRDRPVLPDATNVFGTWSKASKKGETASK
jgi:CRISPR-associated protein (TIGR03986 family)